MDRKQTLLASPADDLDEAVVFAKGFLQNLPHWWTGAGIVNQKRFQRFVFPNGLTVGRNGASRTAKKEQLAGLNELLCTRKSHVVDHEDKSPNRLKQVRRDDHLLQIGETLQKLFHEFREVLA